LDFDGGTNNMTGRFPSSKLKLAANGNLFDMTANSGPFSANQAPGRGTVFEFNFNTQGFILKHVFEESTGQYPTFTHLVEVGAAQNCVGVVDEVIDLTNRSIMTDTTANLRIITNGKVIMGNSFNFYAGGSIEFLTDFEVENSAVFHAYIATCQ